MRKANIIITALVILGISTLVFGQAPPKASMPSAYQVSYSGDINYYNGNLSFNFPLATLGGRGEASFNMMLNLGGEPWGVNVRNEVINCGPSNLCNSRNIYTPAPKNQFSAGLTPGFMKAVSTGKIVGSGCQNAPINNVSLTTRLTTIIFAMPGGGNVTLYDQLYDGKPQEKGQCYPYNGPSRGNIFKSWDGSQMTFVSDTEMVDQWQPGENYAISGTLFMKNGVKYRIDGGRVTKITDRNGNWISFVYDVDANTSMVGTDSIGRTVTVETSGTYLTELFIKIITKGTNGASRTTTMYYSNTSADKGLHLLRNDYPNVLNAAQLFPGLNGTSPTYGGSSDPYPVGGIDKLILPDGRFYKFRYNPYSEIARIEMPTGGAVEYDWAKGFSGYYGNGEFHGSESGSSQSAYGFVYRMITERTGQITPIKLQFQPLKISARRSLIIK
jgi:YD repeat-containing protein